MHTPLYTVAHLVLKLTQKLQKKQHLLNPTQRMTMRRIHRYVVDLDATFANVGDQLSRQQRYQMIDLVTPVQGYVEMLYEGWLGDIHTTLQADIVYLRQLVQQMNDILTGKDQVDKTQHIVGNVG